MRKADRQLLTPSKKSLHRKPDKGSTVSCLLLDRGGFDTCYILIFHSSCWDMLSVQVSQFLVKKEKHNAQSSCIQQYNKIRIIIHLKTRNVPRHFSIFQYAKIQIIKRVSYCLMVKYIKKIQANLEWKLMTSFSMAPPYCFIINL